MFVFKLKTLAVLWTLALFLKNAISSESVGNGLNYKERETLVPNESAFNETPEQIGTLPVEPEHNLWTEMTKQIQELKSIVQSQEIRLAKMEDKITRSGKFMVSNTCGDILESTGGQITYIHGKANSSQLGQSFPKKCIWTIRTEREFTKITTNYDMAQMAGLNNEAFVLEFDDLSQERLRSTRLRPLGTLVFKGPVLFVWLSIADPNPDAFTFQLLFEGLGDLDTKFDNQLSHFTHQFLEYSPSHQINVAPNETQPTLNTVNSVVTLTSNFRTKTFINVNQHNVNCSAMETMMIYADLKQESGEVLGTNCCKNNCQSIAATLDSPLVAIIVKRNKAPLHLSLSMLSESVYEPSYTYQRNGNCGGVISGLNGIIDYKSMQQYDNNERCIWTIAPGGHVAKSISLSVTHSGLEPNYDKLYMMEIFDTNRSILANAPKITNLIETNVTYVGSGKEVYIVFYSDTSFTGKGFKMEYKLESGGSNHAKILNKYNVYTVLNGSIPVKMLDWQRQQQSIAITPKVEQSQVASALRLHFKSSSEGVSPCPMPPYINMFVTINGVFSQLSEPFDCERSEGMHTVMMPITTDAMALLIIDNGNRDFDVDTLISWETEIKPTNVSLIQTDENQCGGVIKADSGVIQYKPDTNLQPDEACIWTIVTENAMLDLKLVRDGMDECCTSLNLFTVDVETTTLRLHTMLSRTNSTSVVNSSVIIIVLKTLYKQQNGTGFYLHFKSTGNSNVQTNFIATHKMQSSGKHSLIWQKSSDDELPYVQTIHIFSHNSNVSDSVLINSNFHYGLFRRNNNCSYETVTVYGFEANGVRQLGQLPSSEEKADCLDQVAVAKISPWFTTSSPGFVVIQKTFSQYPLTSFDWQPQQKKERPFPPEIERRKWHNGIVKYTIDNKTLDATTIQTLKNTFRDFETKTCIRFEPRQPEEMVYTEFRGGAECNHVGGCGMEGKQTTSIGPNCRAINSMARLIMQTLCYPRYDQRPDRDQWLSYTNCTNSNKQPQKIDPNWPVGESLFDYLSISGDSCCQCPQGRPIMRGVACNQCGGDISKTLSVMDADMINELYDCGGCHRHRWRRIENVDKIPPQDMLFLRSGDNAGAMQACRGYVNGEVIVGYYVNSTRQCFLSYGGSVYGLTENAQIFTVPNGKLEEAEGTYRLVERQDVGELKTGKVVEACRRPGGQTGYIAVGKIQERTIIGKVWQTEMNRATFPYRATGREETLSNFQVLIC